MWSLQFDRVKKVRTADCPSLSLFLFDADALESIESSEPLELMDSLRLHFFFLV